MEKKKYEVTLSVRMHGSFVVEAESEQEAEDIIGKKFMNNEIKIADLEVADDEQIDCVGEAEEPPKYICPNSQQPCDEDCSWAEKANCEYYQGLCAGRAESGK